MQRRRRWRHRVRALLARRPADSELDEELRFHLDQQIALFVRQGMDPAAARTEALRLFGGVQKIKEECRDERRVPWLDNLVQDLRFAARTLAHTKGFAALTILTLALGIGANTAIFSVVNGVLLAPLPYVDGDDLVVLDGGPGVDGTRRFTIPEFFDLRDQIDKVELVEHHGMIFTLLGHGYPSVVQTDVVSHNFFDVLGIEPQLGRAFLPSDERHDAEAVLMLTDRYWREKFGADPGVVGQVFEMNDRPHRVIGVLPAVPLYPRDPDVYMPSTACPMRGQWAPVDATTPRGAFPNLYVFGRLAEGTDLDHADDVVRTVATTLGTENPDYYGETGWAVSVRPLQTAMTERARPLLLVLLGTVVLVLAVACANAANLLVARTMRRDRELGLRAAMGAGRGRLLRQLLTESTVLSLAGGVVGLVFASAGLGLLVEFTRRFTPRVDDIEIDAWVLGFTVAVSLLTGIASGVLPALRVHTDVLASLREGASAQTTGARTAMRMRGALIAAQVALSFMLLIGAGLLVNSFIKLSRVDTGFGVENVFSARVAPNWSAYSDISQVAALYTDLLASLDNGPGVASAAVTSFVPLAHGMTMVSGHLAGERPADVPADVPPSRYEMGDGTVEEGWMVELARMGISAEYFETVGLPVIEGRPLTAEEIAGPLPVALVSEAARDRYWGARSPLGSRVAIPDPSSEPGRIVIVWHTIVGVVADARHFGLDIEAPPALFASYRSFGGAGQLVVRTTADAQTMSAFIQETVARIAPLQAVGNFQTMQTIRSAALATPRLMATLMSLFAALAMLITVVGIGGVVAFSVGQRTHEIGIRMALGAERTAVLGMVLRQGLTMVVVGLLLGTVGALWFGSLVARFLFETETTDPVTFVGVAVAVLAATVVACLVPARRATAIEPVDALRVD